MKRSSTFLICLLSFTAVSAQKSLPPLDRLASINDSIVGEAHMLYFSEKINWITTDYFLENHTPEQIGGSLTYFKDSVWVCFFCDKEQQNSISEIRWNIKGKTLQESRSDSIRPLLPEEKQMMERRYRILGKAFDEYRDSIYSLPSKYGKLNFDLIPIGDNITRIYILQGIFVEGILPWGNDYSIDVDSNDNIICFRRHHRSFIPVELKKSEDGEDLVYHTHLEDNQFITATDICNFLMYGRDLYNLKQFMVVSPAFNCNFSYIDSMKTIITLDKNK